MKRSFILFLSLCICLQVTAQHKKGKRTIKASKSTTKKEEKSSSSQFRFKDGETHDFGVIPMGKSVYHEFTFINTGNQPVIILNIRSPYGTTTPEWPKHPINPGAKGTIKVGYTASKAGPFSKEIFIESNATSGRYTIYIKGTVE